MITMLHAPSRRREKILVYGRSDSGKSSTYLDVAAWLSQSDEPNKPTLYIGDTDYAWDVMSGGEYDDIASVTPLDIDSYPKWIEWAKSIKLIAQPDDWLIVDLADTAWTAAQSYYWEQMGVGQTLADVYRMNQQDMGNKAKDAFHMAGAHGANWGIINKYFLEFFITALNAPCHVLMIAQAKEVREEDKAEVKNQYKVGWRPGGPTGEKTEMFPYFNSVLFTSKRTEDKWVYTTVREKGPLRQPGRQYLKGAEVSGFVMTYLVPVAGWSL